MTAPIDGGKLFAVPYELERGPMEKNTLLMDHMAAHPTWMTAPHTPDEARVNAAYMLTDGTYFKWEAWHGGRFAGMIMLSRITPKVDALFHFTLLPSSQSGVTLFSARRLLWNFLGYAFDAFQLQRISAEVPATAPKFAHFMRQRLGFKYEGEGVTNRALKDPKNKRFVEGVVRFDVPGVPTWIAGHGSRRERAHWDGQKWADLILLRLLREEYDAKASLGELPKATDAKPIGEVSDVHRQGDPLEQPVQEG